MERDPLSKSCSRFDVVDTSYTRVPFHQLQCSTNLPCPFTLVPAHQWLLFDQHIQFAHPDNATTAYWIALIIG